MQPQALVRITGTVLSVRHIEIPARAATETAKKYDGGAYEELTLSTAQAHLAREHVEGLVAYVTVRVDTDEPQLESFGPGAELDLLVAPFVDLTKVRNNWLNFVGYRFSRLVSPVRSARVAAAS